MTSFNNTTMRDGQHNNSSTGFVFAPPLSPNSHSSALTTNSSINNKYQSLQPPPVGNAGHDQAVTAGSTVILNGSNSRAPNGIILSYSWKQIPTSAPSTLSGVNTPVWEFVAPNVTADTLLRFQLNVTDNLGQVGTAFVNVLDKPASTSVVQLLTHSQSTAQLLSKVGRGNNSNATERRPSSLPPVQTNLHMVKITSPTKGQQIPVHGNLTVAGTSVANSTSANCEVSVIVNGIKPYQKAVATGDGGSNDYSTWNYSLTHVYAVIKQGQNRITAMFSCGNNPSLTSHNSVNVTGVVNGNSNPAIIASSSQRVSSHNNNNYSKLLISLDLEKNPIIAGDIETFKIMVTDAAVSNVTIAGANVRAAVTDSSNTTTANFNGTTDNSGIFTYTWKVNKDSRPGIFTVGVHASANGYQSLSTPTRTTFKVNSAVVQETVPQRKTVNCRLFILSPGPCS
ncbi:MAG: hypothetical protein WBF33_01215 [Candidatus Nitrosopolaris sp.]